MPNWIEGTLKLRGRSGDLKAFFDDAILPCASRNNKLRDKEDFITFHFGDGWYSVNIKKMHGSRDHKEPLSMTIVKLMLKTK